LRLKLLGLKGKLTGSVGSSSALALLKRVGSRLRVSLWSRCLCRSPHHSRYHEARAAAAVSISAIWFHRPGRSKRPTCRTPTIGFLCIAQCLP